MSDAEWQAFINDRQGAVVGQKLVTLYGFTPGQKVTLKSPIYNQSVEFIVRGVCTGGDEKTLFFHSEYLNELLPDWAKDQASVFTILANSAEEVPRIAQTIDSTFVNTDAPTKTETEREFALSFMAMMGGVKKFLYRHHGRDYFFGVVNHGQHNGDDSPGTNQRSGHLEGDWFSAKHDRGIVSWPSRY